MRKSETQSPEELCHDLRTLVAEAERILAAAPVASETNGADESVTLRARLQDARERIAGYYDSARRNVVAGARFADKSVRNRPYQSLAVAIGTGVLIGLLLGRRRD